MWISKWMFGFGPARWRVNLGMDFEMDFVVKEMTILTSKTIHLEIHLEIHIATPSAN